MVHCHRRRDRDSIVHKLRWVYTWRESEPGQMTYFFLLAVIHHLTVQPFSLFHPTTEPLNPAPYHPPPEPELSSPEVPRVPRRPPPTPLERLIHSFSRRGRSRASSAPVAPPSPIVTHQQVAAQSATRTDGVVTPPSLASPVPPSPVVPAGSLLPPISPSLLTTSLEEGTPAPPPFDETERGTVWVEKVQQRTSGNSNDTNENNNSNNQSTSSTLSSSDDPKKEYELEVSFLIRMPESKEQAAQRRLERGYDGEEMTHTPMEVGIWRGKLET